MACARVPLDEQQVTEPGPSGKEHTLPALVRASTTCFNTDIFITYFYGQQPLYCLETVSMCLFKKK